MGQEEIRDVGRVKGSADGAGSLVQRRRPVASGDLMAAKLHRPHGVPSGIVTGNTEVKVADWRPAKVARSPQTASKPIHQVREHEWTLLIGQPVDWRDE